MDNVDDYSSDNTSLIPSSFEVDEEHDWIEEDEDVEVENDLGLEEREQRRPLPSFSFSPFDHPPSPPTKAWWTEEYESVEGMPGYIYLTRPLPQKKDDLKETLSEKKEDVPMTTTEEPMPVITEPEPEPEPELVPVPVPVVVADSIQNTNSWSSGRIYKALNITDPAEAAAAAAEAAEAAAARAKAEEAAARAARAKTDTTSGRRPQGSSTREPRRHNEPSIPPRGLRVSVLRPTSGTITPSHPDPRQSGQKQRPDRDRGQQGPRDQEIQARTDLLCRFPASRHSSRDREPCTRSHSLADWSPRACHHHPCSRPACTFYHPTTESKKEYLEKILQNKASFYATHSRDFHKLYLQ